MISKVTHMNDVRSEIKEVKKNYYHHLPFFHSKNTWTQEKLDLQRSFVRKRINFDCSYKWERKLCT